MSESETIEYKIGLEIKKETKYDLSTTNFEFNLEDAVSVTENPIEWDNCKVEIDETYMKNETVPYLHPNLVKKEIEDSIKTDDVLPDRFLLFNTDIPLCVEEFIPINIFYCYVCNYGTNDKENLTDHIFSHRFNCSQCKYTTPDAFMLRSHLQIHSTIGSLRCKVCKFTCGEIDSFDKHMSKHDTLEIDKKFNRKDLFECSDCRYSTISEVSFVRHVRMCFNCRTKKIKCKKCEYTTSEEKRLEQHVIDEHELNQKCNFSTNKKSILINHVQRHIKNWRKIVRKQFVKSK
ncbi:hypothetical protein FQR65_LT15746 [Abscondita terminalis]|nr:hypothetical protein FQR65_LT15746 [Abscondita terminalis]